MNDQGGQELETPSSEYLPGEAHQGNRIVEKTIGLKFVELTGDQLRELTEKLNVSVPQRLLQDGLIVIGPDSNLHHVIIAAALGLKNEAQTDQKIESIFIEAKYNNAGKLINMFNGKSFITGTSMTLSNSEGASFNSLEGTAKKKELDIATQKRLNKMYADTWEFETS